ncbi:Two-component sensor histidine kinase, contains HisKA and HATPase domains [Flaviramulus basaltis]|uniref:histidine kinase n=1 Tax=Flaviramulus basaltis TaxID=369401 RepID=A0A1K2INF2_9FLAO|nr:histidine kinase dimerization/phosphoacceptor domain -containing protein [Flaviramulus basaltis]SFZ93972.1 Two-component sensor histidine kinase, contains HisKA and HATPase domains [Flaviramulus basaltis]
MLNSFTKPYLRVKIFLLIFLLISQFVLGLNTIEGSFNNLVSIVSATGIKKILTNPKQKTKLTPKALIELSDAYTEKASWFSMMPQYNVDSSKYYVKKAFSVLNPNEPLHKDKLARLNFKRLKSIISTYSYAKKDSLTKIEWNKIKNLPLISDENRLLNYDYLVYWADIKLLKGEHKESLNLFSQALALIKESDSPKIKAKMELDKGLYYAKYGLPEEIVLSKKALQKSLKYYEQVKTDEKSVELYMIYAQLVYLHTGKNQDSTMFYLNRVKSVLKNYKKPTAMVWYYTMYAWELIMKPIPEQENVNIEQFEEAKQNIFKALKILEKSNQEKSSFYPYCFELLAEIELKTKHYDTAIENYIKARLHYLEINEHTRGINSLQNIAAAYEESGNLSKALEYKEKFYTESLASEKEKNERSLRESELQLNLLSQDKSLARQQSQQVILLVALSIGIISLILMFRNYRLKRMSNLKLGTLNQELNIKNQQNELLLKEIHHRVKNNLELVKSLISLQSAQLEDSETKDAMIASQNRVQSMGIIHQKLYQGENLGSIEMKDYFLNLGEGILDTFNADEKVKIECAMDNLELDVDTAVPIGLIVNELLTNALKYAFPKNSEGNISISLSKSNPETLILKVIDNGIGKTKGLAPKGTGFGSQLIKLLTQQLNGEMEEDTLNGTSVLFHFKLNTAA